MMFKKIYYGFVLVLSLNVSFVQPITVKNCTPDRLVLYDFNGKKSQRVKMKDYGAYGTKIVGTSIEGYQEITLSKSTSEFTVALDHGCNFLMVLPCSTVRVEREDGNDFDQNTAIEILVDKDGFLYYEIKEELGC